MQNSYIICPKKEKKFFYVSKTILYVCDQSISIYWSQNDFNCTLNFANDFVGLP
jgi:hypothetical protein